MSSGSDFVTLLVECSTCRTGVDGGGHIEADRLGSGRLALSRLGIIRGPRPARGRGRRWCILSRWSCADLDGLRGRGPKGPRVVSGSELGFLRFLLSGGDFLDPPRRSKPSWLVIARRLSIGPTEPPEHGMGSKDGSFSRCSNAWPQRTKTTGSAREH